MAYTTAQSSGELWTLARRQHGVVSRAQLLELGYSAQAITHRVAGGRLHRIRRGVYAVGRPEIGTLGRWMSAVLCCGPEAVLSHESAGALWGVLSGPALTEVSVPAPRSARHRGIAVHRRQPLSVEEVTTKDRIPVTVPIVTVIDLAAKLPRERLEAVVSEADRLDLATPEDLRVDLERFPRRPGVAPLRILLDRQTFVLTESELERLFMPIARAAGLDLPLTGAEVNGFKVDFYWPELGLIVETDGLRYHRTPGQQAKDRLRDQVHTAAGLTCLRFSHAQIRFDPEHVRSTLSRVAARLAALAGIDCALL